jgi:hypothetical protein
MNSVTRVDHAERVREFYRRQGEQREQQRIMNMLQQFFDLSMLDEVDVNTEWDNGFQAAMALIRSNK